MGYDGSQRYYRHSALLHGETVTRPILGTDANSLGMPLVVAYTCSAAWLPEMPYGQRYYRHSALLHKEQVTRPILGTDAQLSLTENGVAFSLNSLHVFCSCHRGMPWWRTIAP